MEIFYRCSFKSSSGYKLAKYDCDSHALEYIDEHDEADQRGISRVIRSTFLQGLGRSMVLAVDERGYFFLGIYNLVEGNYDKYVNTVFADKDSVGIIRLFEWFCSQYHGANKALKNTVKRVPPDETGLEFCIETEKIDRLLSDAGRMEGHRALKPKPGQLYAFVTENNDGDYLERLTQRCGFSCENAIWKGDVAEDQERLDIRVSGIYLRNSIRYVIATGVMIFVIIVFWVFFLQHLVV